MSVAQRYSSWVILCLRMNQTNVRSRSSRMVRVRSMVMNFSSQFRRVEAFHSDYITHGTPPVIPLTEFCSSRSCGRTSGVPELSRAIRLTEPRTPSHLASVQTSGPIVVVPGRYPELGIGRVECEPGVAVVERARLPVQQLLRIVQRKGGGGGCFDRGEHGVPRHRADLPSVSHEAHMGRLPRSAHRILPITDI